VFPALPGVRQGRAGCFELSEDFLAFLDPGQGESAGFEHVIRQPPFRLLEWIFIQVEGFAFSGQVFKLTFLDGAADLFFSVGHGQVFLN